MHSSRIFRLRQVFCTARHVKTGYFLDSVLVGGYFAIRGNLNVVIRHFVPAVLRIDDVTVILVHRNIRKNAVLCGNFCFNCLSRTIIENKSNVLLQRSPGGSGNFVHLHSLEGYDVLRIQSLYARIFTSASAAHIVGEFVVGAVLLSIDSLQINIIVIQAAHGIFYTVSLQDRLPFPLAVLCKVERNSASVFKLLVNRIGVEVDFISVILLQRQKIFYICCTDNGQSTLSVIESLGLSGVQTGYLPRKTVFRIVPFIGKKQFYPTGRRSCTRILYFRGLLHYNLLNFFLRSVDSFVIVVLQRSLSVVSCVDALQLFTVVCTHYIMRVPERICGIKSDFVLHLRVHLYAGNFSILYLITSGIGATPSVIHQFLHIDEV